MSLFFTILVTLVTLIIGAATYIKWKLTFWQNLGVPTLNPLFLYGDLKDIIKNTEFFGIHFQKLYTQFKTQGAKFGGIYMGPKPLFIPIDPELIKNILQKDFNYFYNRGTYYNEKHDPLSGNIFHLEDEKWRNTRNKLTPTFTSGKIKTMFEVLLNCTKQLDVILADHAIRNERVEIKELLARYSTDVIGNVAFGLECNTLKNPEADFRVFGRKALLFTPKIRLAHLLTFFLPRNLLNFLGLRTTLGEVEEFFMGVVKRTVEYRETNSVYRKDFMHLLIQLKNLGKITDDGQIKNSASGIVENAITFNELAAQAFIFYLAGFETTSSAMTFALYELAFDQTIQNRARDEVRQILEKHGTINYEAIQEMTYLDNIIYGTYFGYCGSSCSRVF